MKVPNADFLEQTRSEILSAALAVAARQRQHAPQASSGRGVLFRRGGRRPHPRRGANVDRAAARRGVDRAAAVAAGVQRHAKRRALADYRRTGSGISARRITGHIGLLSV